MSTKDSSRPIEYELKDGLEYAKGGEMVEASFVTLHPPSAKHLTECADLKQAFFRSLPDDDGRELDKSKDLPELDGDAIMTMIAMSRNVELKVVLLTAKQLFKNGVAFLEGEQKMTTPLLEAMSLDDLQSMTGCYMVNFILASSLKKMKDNFLTA